MDYMHSRGIVHRDVKVRGPICPERGQRARRGRSGASPRASLSKRRVAPPFVCVRRDVKVRE